MIDFNEYWFLGIMLACVVGIFINSKVGTSQVVTHKRRNSSRSDSDVGMEDNFDVESSTFGIGLNNLNNSFWD